MGSGSDDAEYRAGGRLRSFKRGKLGFRVALSSGFVLFDGTRQVVTQAGDHDANPEDELGRIDDRGDGVDRGVQDCWNVGQASGPSRCGTGRLPTDSKQRREISHGIQEHETPADPANGTFLVDIIVVSEYPESESDGRENGHRQDEAVTRGFANVAVLRGQWCAANCEQDIRDGYTMLQLENAP
jgi:hypothetical protein